MKPAVCVKCGLFFKIKKNSVVFEEGMPVNALGHDFAAPQAHWGCQHVVSKPGELYIECGKPKPDHVAWQPYKLWIGDLWECRGCGAEILIGMPMQPFAEHYQPDYEKTKALRPPALRVNDC